CERRGAGRETSDAEARTAVASDAGQRTLDASTAPAYRSIHPASSPTHRAGAWQRTDRQPRRPDRRPRGSRHRRSQREVVLCGAEKMSPRESSHSATTPDRGTTPAPPQATAVQAESDTPSARPEAYVV